VKRHTTSGGTSPALEEEANGSMIFDAIVFDMDGVILDSMPFHYRAWKRALGEAGIEVTELDIYLHEGMKWHQTIAELAGDRGSTISEARADEIYDAKRRYFHEIFQARFFPGVRQGLADLRILGYRLALVTGSTHDVVERVIGEYLPSFFEAIVTSDRIVEGKPSPEPYRTAVQMLSLEPERCLAVENSPAGVASAKAAGLTCYAVTTSLPAEHLRGADRIFSQPREVLRVLEEDRATEREG
jgi:beta-phosphoglucomutase